MPSNPTRRAGMSLFLVAALSLAAVPGRTQSAEPYPSRPVRILIPFAAGGPGDLIARLLAQKLSEKLGKQFYVENHPGGGGNIGTGLAARAPADGYTVLLTSATFMINASLYPKIPYDPVKDFDPVTIAATTPNVLIVHPSVPARTVQELIASIRAGRYTNFAQPGVGTPPNMSAELFRLSLGLDLTPVPFGGGGPMLQSVIGGHTPIAFSALAPALGQIRDGLVRPLAVTSASRDPLLPDVPTLAEAGVPGQEADTPQCILVPAGTPRPIVDLLYRTIAQIVGEEDFKDRLTAIGFEPVVVTPEAFAARIKTEIPRWAKVVRDANLKPE